MPHPPHIQSVTDGGAGLEGRGEQPLNSQHCTLPCIQAQAPHYNAAHDLSTPRFSSRTVPLIAHCLLLLWPTQRLHRLSHKL